MLLSQDRRAQAAQNTNCEVGEVRLSVSGRTRLEDANTRFNLERIGLVQIRPSAVFPCNCSQPRLTDSASQARS